MKQQRWRSRNGEGEGASLLKNSVEWAAAGKQEFCFSAAASHLLCRLPSSIVGFRLFLRPSASTVLYIRMARICVVCWSRGVTQIASLLVSVMNGPDISSSAPGFHWGPGVSITPACSPNCDHSFQMFLKCIVVVYASVLFFHLVHTYCIICVCLFPEINVSSAIKLFTLLVRLFPSLNFNYFFPTIAFFGCTFLYFAAPYNFPPWVT